jgi:N-methylhydantoinase A
MARRTGKSQSLCIGVDIGGTFTDAVLTDGMDTWRAKAETTTEDPNGSVLAACGRVAGLAGKTLKQLLPGVGRFGLGSTTIANVLASRTGLSVGLITTRAFEDQIPLAKGLRITDGGWLRYPEQLVPRRRIIGVEGRLDRDGKELRPLDPAEVIEAGRRLVEREGVQAVAVSFLWSFKNPIHEEMATALLRETFPNLPVMSGVELNPVIREFERTTFAIMNAYTMSGFGAIDALQEELAALGLSVPILLIHSSGGCITVNEARRVPTWLVESGRAAGVAASMSLAEATGLEDVITCDIGGTSFDVSVCTHGQPSRRNRGEIFGTWTSLPLIDVESINGGGGSIGWVDSRTMLRVGPHSAGAAPGPVCYGRGATEPTLTDALLLLGYIDASRFLGGEMNLDLDGTRQACGRLGSWLSLEPTETAWGIRQIALEGMVKAVRSILNTRGLDPHKHQIISYGGCGALFTPEIAQTIGVRRVLIPELAAVWSGFGAAAADVRREKVHSLAVEMPIDALLLQALSDKLRTEVLDDLAADGVAECNRSVEFEADLRFKRQVWELTIPIPPGIIDAVAVSRLLDNFRTEYQKRYGQSSILRGAAVELVTFRAVGVGSITKASVSAGHRERVPEGTPAPSRKSRLVQIERGERGLKKVRTHYGPDLRPGHRIGGPALVDQLDTTVWIPPRCSAYIDMIGTLVVEVGR